MSQKPPPVNNVPLWAMMFNPPAARRIPDRAPASNLLPVQEAAAYLGVSEKTVRRLIKAQDISVVRVGRLVRIRPDELKRFVEASTACSASTVHVETADE